MLMILCTLMVNNHDSHIHLKAPGRHARCPRRHRGAALWRMWPLPGQEHVLPDVPDGAESPWVQLSVGDELDGLWKV
jgi:hypothetical protein